MKQEKKFRGFFFMNFYNVVHLSSLKHVGLERFSRFDVYWIQTDRHPDRLNVNGATSHLFQVNIYIPLLQNSLQTLCSTIYNSFWR